VNIYSFGGEPDPEPTEREAPAIRHAVTTKRRVHVRPTGAGYSTRRIRSSAGSSAAPTRQIQVF
jgi:hypothetical protein